MMQGSIQEENTYYPFGMLNTGLSNSGVTDPINNYKYNGKELQTDLDLQWLDYGARFYDPVIGRWHSVDLLAEKYRRWSPNTYCYDNPMRFIDPDGMDPILDGAYNNQKYGVMVVLPKTFGYNKALTRDYKAAKNEGLPIMLVDNMKDFSIGMNQLKKGGIFVNTYAISQHGAPGVASIGDEVVTSKTDFTSLKDGLNGKNVALLQCNVSKNKNGQELIQKFSNETNTNVVASDHSIQSGYITDTSLSTGWFLNMIFGDGTKSNDFHIAEPNQLSKEIYDLMIRKNGMFVWNTKDNKK